MKKSHGKDCLSAKGVSLGQSSDSIGSRRRWIRNPALAVVGRFDQ